jgi:hypothetical protein
MRALRIVSCAFPRRILYLHDATGGRRALRRRRCDARRRHIAVAVMRMLGCVRAARATICGLPRIALTVAAV